MKNKLPTILLALSLTSMLGFSTGDEIELDSYLSGRTSPNFLKYTKNIAAGLEKGTKGEVVEIKNFPDRSDSSKTGNSGIKMKITSGPKAGQTYWVYYNKADPAIKLATRDSVKSSAPKIVEPKAIEPETIPLNKNDQPTETIAAEIIKDVVARRDMEEHSVEEAARLADIALGKEFLGEAVGPKMPPCVSAIENAVTPPPEASSTFTPQAALADLNSGDLKFIGRDLMPGSGQNKTCIFQNAKVYVLYNNCMANRKEAQATDIEIISKEGGSVKLYLEIFNSGKRMSQLNRDEYKNGTFSVVYTKTPPPGNLTVKKTIDYVKANEINGDACFIGDSFGAQKTDNKAMCIGGVQDKVSDWAPSAESFWKNPPPEWYSTQSKLRKLVETVPF